MLEQIGLDEFFVLRQAFRAPLRRSAARDVGKKICRPLETKLPDRRRRTGCETSQLIGGIRRAEIFVGEADAIDDGAAVAAGQQRRDDRVAVRAPHDRFEFGRARARTRHYVFRKAVHLWAPRAV